VKKIAMLVPIAVLLIACGSTQSSETSTQQSAGETSTTATLQSCPDAITWDQASAHAGELATITGPTISAVYASDSRGQPTFLNIGKPYPDPNRFTVVIWGYDRDNFPTPPDMKYDNTTICITGLIETYKGIPQITADAASDIEIVE
jgi:hypothetical protein